MSIAPAGLARSFLSALLGGLLGVAGNFAVRGDAPLAAQSSTNAVATPASPAKEDANVEKRYVEAYLEMDHASQLAKQGNVQGATAGFQDCYFRFMEIHNSNPDWEKDLIGQRMNECRAGLRSLYEHPGTSTHETSSLMPLLEEPASPGKTVHPWKTNIKTTMFWIGKNGKTGSAWDKHWLQKNHGEDSPDARNGYAPSDHAPLVNPFYVALPFDDDAFPEMAKKWVPPSWQAAVANGKLGSVCQHHWVEIKNATGHICYAQWEDAGPLRNDEVEYVFGNEKPKGAGLSLSPAVAQYLGWENGAVLSWRLVDDEDVSPGAWLKYDELAVVYAALKEINH